MPQSYFKSLKITNYKEKSSTIFPYIYLKGICYYYKINIELYSNIRISQIIKQLVWGHTNDLLQQKNIEILQNDITEMFGFSVKIEKQCGHNDMKW